MKHTHAMLVRVVKDIECTCDGCGKKGTGRVFFGVAISPPRGWFVHGRIALDDVVGDVEQWFYCSEECATKIDDAVVALAEIAEYEMN